MCVKARIYRNVTTVGTNSSTLFPFQSIREVELKSLHGRKVAIDASMAIYQFLIAVRSGGPNQQAMMLTNAEGETTSHIQGMFNRTIRFMTEGIRPVFVFDGKPPSIKSHELTKRREKREKAQAALKVASEEGNVEDINKQDKRLVRAGTKENNDCKKLLELMGVPVVNAPCEAEAQAAALAQSGQVYAAGKAFILCYLLSLVVAPFVGRSHFCCFLIIQQHPKIWIRSRSKHPFSCAK